MLVKFKLVNQINFLKIELSDNQFIRNRQLNDNLIIQFQTNQPTQKKLGLNSSAVMAAIEKKQVKTVQDYRHSIKLLKYHLKKQTKTNQNLKYQFAKLKVHGSKQKQFTHQKPRTIQDSVKIISTRLKHMGLVLGDIFRMADAGYEGQISKQQFMKTMQRTKCDIQEPMLNQMFYAIDSSLNGLISQDQYQQFVIAYGGGDSKLARKYQNKALVRFATLLKKANQNPENFISTMKDPVPSHVLHSALRKLGLNGNQIMLANKAFDPSQNGQIRHQTFLKIMSSAMVKDQKKMQEKQQEKDIQKLCVILRQRKINPIVIFDQADADQKNGVSPLELQQAFRKIIPQQTTFQIKKWVHLINLNGDAEITREEYMNSIRCFYSIDQLNKFSKDDSQRSKPKKLFKNDQVPVQQIMQQLSQKIEDTGMSKKELFDFIDINKNGGIDNEQLMDGLKGIGLNINFIGRVLSVFDRDESGQISLEQWLHLLNQDEEMSDVDLPPSVPVIQNKKAQKQNKKKNDNIKKTEIKQKQPIEKSTAKQKKPMETSTTKQKKNIETSTTKQKKPMETSKQKKPMEASTNKKISKKQSKFLEDQSISKKQIKNQKQAPKVPAKNMQKSIKSQTKIEQKPQKKNISKIGQKSEKTEKPQKKSQENKTTKKVEKQQAKPVEQQNQFEEEEQYGQKFEMQEDQDKFNNIQKQIGVKYKKNKKLILAIFQKHDQKKLKYVSEKAFKVCLKDMNPKLKEQEKVAIVQKVMTSDGIVMYEEWLQQLAEQYAQNVKQQPQIQIPLKKQITGQQAKRIDNVLDFIKKDQTQNKEKQLIQNKDKNLKRESISKIPGLADMLPKNTVEKLVDVTKRGQGINAFEELLKLEVRQNESSKKGYKIQNYIDCKDEIAKLNKEYLPKAEKLKKSNKRFVDTSFPADLNSITKIPSKTSIKNVTMLKWKHYKDIFKNPQLFAGGVDPNDIRQGGLGNCYFLTALSCLAQYTNMIQRLFEYFDMEIGYFLIWLCIDGNWRLIQLDGMIPTDPSGSQPAFSKTQAEQIWVILLQKAYAKAYGDYEKISGGQPYEAIKDLSGGPGISWLHKNTKQQQLWKKLVNANQKQFMMSCGTDQRQGNEKIQGHAESITKQGIVLGHAYAILDVAEVRGEKILKLRNPWGDIEWKGDWSDKSSKWTPQLRKKLNHSGNDNDGTFWMPFTKFFSEYNLTAINYINPVNYYTSLQQTNIKMVAVKPDGGKFKQGYFMVSQKDHRHQGRPANDPYILAQLISFTCVNGKVKRKLNQHRFLYQREGCAQFQQIAQNQQPMMLIGLQKSTNINIGYYGDAKIEFDVQNNCLPLLQGLAYLDQNSEKAQQQGGKFKTWMSTIGDIGFLCFKNISQGDYTLVVQLSNPNNVKIMPPQGTKNPLKLKVGQISCIKGKITNVKEGYSFGQMRLSMES